MAGWCCSRATSAQPPRSTSATSSGRRLTLTGATLRPRPPAYKGRIARELVAQVWPLLEDGRIRIHICATFPLAAVAEAHALMDANEQIGKVVLTVAATLR